MRSWPMVHTLAPALVAAAAPLRSRAFFALALSLSGCAGIWPSVDLATLPTAADYPGAYAVVLLDEKLVDFHAGLDGKPVAEVTTHVRGRLLRPGAEGLGGGG